MIRHIVTGRRENARVRELARRYSVHRRTVRQALASASPPPRKVPMRKAPRLDPVKPLIDAMLREDLTAPRKQRHTARRIVARWSTSTATTSANGARLSGRECSTPNRCFHGGQPRLCT